MGDFVGGTLKYLRRHPIARVTLAGGFAKLAKLAAGPSRPAFEPLDGRPAGARRRCSPSTAPPATLIDHARGASIANQILQLAQDGGLPLADDVARRARQVALEPARRRRRARGA